MADATPPPDALAMDMVLAGWRSQALVAFVKTGIADAMKYGVYNDPKTLADKCKLNADAVNRLLRFLSTVNVCIEEEITGGTYKLGVIGEVCSRSHPQSVTGAILLEGSKQHVSCWTNLSEFLKTGEKVMKITHGVNDYWDMCKADSSHLKIFQAGMGGYSKGEAAMIEMDQLSPTLDMSKLGIICDIGGGEGTLLQVLAQRFPKNSYILAELTEVVKNMDGTSFPSNIKLSATDFFKKETIPKANAYILKHILHDWDDVSSIKILENIKAVNPEAKVFILEFGPMPGPNIPHLSKLFDLHMAILLSGSERSQEEYNALYAKSGYKLTTTHLLAAGNHPLYIQEIDPLYIQEIEPGQLWC